MAKKEYKHNINEGGENIDQPEDMFMLEGMDNYPGQLPDFDSEPEQDERQPEAPVVFNAVRQRGALSTDISKAKKRSGKRMKRSKAPYFALAAILVIAIAGTFFMDDILDTDNNAPKEKVKVTEKQQLKLDDAPNLLKEKPVPAEKEQPKESAKEDKTLEAVKNPVPVKTVRLEQEKAKTNITDDIASLPKPERKKVELLAQNPVQDKPKAEEKSQRIEEKPLQTQKPQPIVEKPIEKPVIKPAPEVKVTEPKQEIMLPAEKKEVKVKPLNDKKDLAVNSQTNAQPERQLPGRMDESVTNRSIFKTAPNRSGGAALYSVQVYSTPIRQDAEEWAEKLSKRDAKDIFITEQKVRDKTWYRVRFGSFKTKEEAKAAALKLGFAQSWIDRIR